MAYVFLDEDGKAVYVVTIATHTEPDHALAESLVKVTRNARSYVTTEYWDLSGYVEDMSSSLISSEE